MKVKLNKLHSSHNLIDQEYIGEAEELPTLGKPFFLFYGALFEGYIRTTPVLETRLIRDNVIEFRTKNSVYLLDLN